MDRWGRKLAYLLAVTPGIIGWLMIYLAEDLAVLFIGRVLTGITTGATVTAGLVVLGEFTNPKHRGMFLNLKTASFYLGNTFVHILDMYTDWRTNAIVVVIPHVAAFLIACTWPESPAWYAAKKKFDKCERDFYWLRGTSEQSVREVKHLIEAQKSQPPLSLTELSVPNKIVEFFKKFSKKEFIKPLIVASFACFLVEATGRHFFPAYALQIMDDIVNTKTEPYYFTLFIDLINVASGTISTILITIWKRRTLLFSTGLASLIVSAFMCTYLLLVSCNVLSKDWNWVIISLVIMYFSLVNLGCAPIAMALHGEIFPLAYRETAQFILGLLSSICVMGLLKIIPHLLLAVEVYGTFIIFGIISGVCLLVLYFLLPETKDRTLQEIDDYFLHGKFKDDRISIQYAGEEHSSFIQVKT